MILRISDRLPHRGAIPVETLSNKALYAISALSKKSWNCELNHSHGS
jgi:hypothetical protein